MRWVVFLACAGAFLSGAAVAETREAILPIVVNGYTREPIHFQTKIRIVNLSPSSVEVTLEAYQNDGTAVRILELFPVARTGTTTVLKIAPLGSIESVTAEDIPALDGWARLTYDSLAAIAASAELDLIDAPVGPHPICRRPSHEILASAELPAVQAARKFNAFAIDHPYRRSAYAFLNPSPVQTAHVFLSLLDSSGNLAASKSFEIRPQARIAKFVAELFSNIPSSFTGSLRVTADIPVAAGALQVLFPEGKLINVPMAALELGPCTQVITPARNPLTGECRDFPTPCDVPEGWQTVASCK
ncbi:MAG: hypothetical protein HY645_06230 [Acidobacteria bacterium]|nr:hypothetical protein [Acidobacteriota bacterium]